MANPRLPDTQTREQQLQNRRDCETPLKDSIKMLLRVNDEQIATGRYKLPNIAPELDTVTMMRIMYYRATGMLFFMPEVMKWAYLPYTLTGGIDIYGRYKEVTPLPFNGTSTSTKEDAESPLGRLLSTMKRRPVYDLSEEILPDEFLEDRCVLVWDYTPQISQNLQPRYKLNDGLIDIEANIIPYINTLLANSAGVAGMRVSDRSEEQSVQDASNTVQRAALNCKRWVGITAPLQLQDFSTVAAGKAEDMLMAMQSIDNFRLGTYGIENGGLFEKKAHLLNAEAAMNVGTSSIVLDDGLRQWQRMVDTVNYYVLKPLGVPDELLWRAELRESVTGGDTNMDGVIGGENPTNPGNAQGTNQETNGGNEDGES